MKNAPLNLEVIVRRLDIDSRLLLYIVREIILCKSGNYYTTSDTELFLMQVMHEKEPINLPYIILKRMIYIARRQTSPLPYGSLIAHILKVLKANVSTIKEDYILPIKVDNATLKGIGYIK